MTQNDPPSLTTATLYCLCVGRVARRFRRNASRPTGLVGWMMQEYKRTDRLELQVMRWALPADEDAGPPLLPWLRSCKDVDDLDVSTRRRPRL